MVKAHKAAEWQLLGSCNRPMVIERKTCLVKRLGLKVSAHLSKAVTYNSDWKNAVNAKNVTEQPERFHYIPDTTSLIGNSNPAYYPQL